jgi:hypothetical protein
MRKMGLLILLNTRRELLRFFMSIVLNILGLRSYLAFYNIYLLLYSTTSYLFIILSYIYICI